MKPQGIPRMTRKSADQGVKDKTRPDPIHTVRPDSVCARCTTAATSATCGDSFGETNELTSIARSPLAASAGFSIRERR